MKKSMILATALAAALCAAPLAACNSKQAEVVIDGKEFKLADYALPIEDYSPYRTIDDSKSYVLPTYTKLTEKKNFKLDDLTTGNSLAGYFDTVARYLARLEGTGENAEKFQLYSFLEDKTVSSTYYSDLDIVSGDYHTNHNAYMLTYRDTETSTTKRDFVGPTGAKLTTDEVYYQYARDCSFEFIETYEKEDPEASDDTTETTCYFSFTYYKTVEDDRAEEQTTKYYSLVEEQKNDEISKVTWTEVKEADTKANPYEKAAPEVSVDDTLPVHAKTTNEDYTYGVTGSQGRTYTFYKDGAVASTITLPAQAMTEDVQFIGDYLFFFKVGTDGTGKASKEESGLYRINYTTAGDAEKTGFEFYPVRIQPIENQTTGIVDKAIVYATDYDRYGHVTAATTYNVFVIDDEGKISADFTDSDASLDSGIYKLTDDRFLIGDLLVDAAGKSVATLDLGTEGSITPYLWPANNAIVIDDGHGFQVADYDGKVLSPYIDKSVDNTYFVGKTMVPVVSSYTSKSAKYYTLGERNSKSFSEFFSVDTGTNAKSGYQFIPYLKIVLKYEFPTNGKENVNLFNFDNSKIGTINDVAFGGNSPRFSGVYEVNGTYYLEMHISVSEGSEVRTYVLG